MTEEQFKNVKYGDTLLYPYDGVVEKVRAISKYRFAGGGRIRAVVIDSITGLETTDAPYNCFNVMP